MEWNKLSLAEKAEYMRLGVQNGVTSLNRIREVYNEYARGGKVNKLQDGGGQMRRSTPLQHWQDG